MGFAVTQGHAAGGGGVIGPAAGGPADGLQPCNLADVISRAVEQSRSIVMITDVTGVIEYVNPVFCRLTGYAREEVLGRHVDILKSGQTPPQVYATLWEALKDGRGWSGELLSRNKCGQVFREAVEMSPVRNAKGTIEHYLKVAEDITARTAMEEELKEGQNRYERIVMAMRGFMFTVLLDGGGKATRTVYYAGSEQVTGYSARDYESDPMLWFRMILEEDRERVTTLIRTVLSEKVTRGIEHRIRHKNGSVRWVRSLSVPTFDAQGAMIAYDGLITDVTELKQSEAMREELLTQLRNSSVRDPLTGLYSRRGFKEELDRIWELCDSDALRLGLLIVDVDHFKVLNDTYGHAVGDQILVEAARLMTDTVRVSDVVCRYGGDEMVVIVPLTSFEEVHAVSGRLVESFRAHTFCHGTHDVKVTVSIGAAGGAAGDRAAQEILLRADKALYRAKQAGRNRVCVSQPGGASEFTGQQGEELIGAVSERRANVSTDSLGTVLIVDDDAVICRLLRSILESHRYCVATAANAAQATAIAVRERGCIDVAVVDVGLPDGNGFDLLRQLRALDDAIEGIVMTGSATASAASEALRAGAIDFIMKPVAADAFRIAVERAIRSRCLLQENRRYQQHLENMVAERSAALIRALDKFKHSYRATLEMVAALVDVREKQAGGHGKRVAAMAELLAREMKLAHQDVETIGQGGLLHDIGRLAVPDTILQRQGELTAAERQILQSHPRIGYEILRACPALDTTADIVHSHKERFDGTGYPHGLKGAEICLGARLLTVADAYDAMRYARPGSQGLSVEAAAAEIAADGGKQFDPAVVDAFLRCQHRLDACVAGA